MNTIINETKEIIESYKKENNFHPDREVKVVISSGNQEVITTLLDHRKILQKYCNVTEVYIDHETTGSTHVVAGKEIRFSIAKGDGYIQ